MALQLYMDFAKILLEEAKTRPIEQRPLCYDESTLMYMKALKHATSPDQQEIIKDVIIKNFNNHSSNMQKRICKIFMEEEHEQGQTTVPPIPSSGSSGKQDINIDSCKVTKFEKVNWADVILKPQVKKNIREDIIEPLKLYEAKLRGVMPGHLLGSKLKKSMKYIQYCFLD